MYRDRQKNILASASQHFTIAGNELANLCAWKYWNHKQCFTGRYIYTFGGTALGVAIKITDTTTSETIDITDYSGW